MIGKDLVYAVVGASNNPEKYGNRVLKDLKEAGYQVIPINPHEEMIEGLKVFPSLRTVGTSLDVVITVVPPSITETIVKEAHELGIKKIWMQPGSESDTAVRFCEENGIECVHHACIMIQRKQNRH